MYAHDRIGDAWSVPKLIVEAPLADGDDIALAADASQIAAGWPDAVSGTGRVDIWSRADAGWTLSASLTTPANARRFGRTVSINDALLVAAGTAVSEGGAYVHAFRRDDEGRWVDAGYSSAGYLGFGPNSAATDGEYIATCVMQSCMRLARNGPGWAPDTHGPWVNAPGALALDGDWLIASIYGGSLRASRRTGVEWQSVLHVTDLESFAASRDTLVVRHHPSAGSRGTIYERVGDEWLAGVDTPIWGASTMHAALGDGVAAFGEQTLIQSAGGWGLSGIVAAEPNAEWAKFGNAIVMVGADAWIGSPGASSSDLRSGAVYRFPVSGIPDFEPSMVPGLASPALDAALGRALATDGTRVVAASLDAADRASRIVVYDASPTPQKQTEIDVPNADGNVFRLDVAIHSSVLAFTRRFFDNDVIRAEVHVFREGPTGFGPAGVIALPDDASTLDGYGENVELSDGWLLAGRRMYRESGANWIAAGELGVPDGVLISSQRAVAASGRLVVPAFDDGDLAALVYEIDAAHGWVLTGRMHWHPSAPMEGCALVATDGLRAACIAVSSGGQHSLFLADLPSSGMNWDVSMQGPHPGGLPHMVRTLAISGDRVLFGFPDTGSEPQGTDIGRVVILGFNDEIFASGFDVP